MKEADASKETCMLIRNGSSARIALYPTIAYGYHYPSRKDLVGLREELNAPRERKITVADVARVLGVAPSDVVGVEDGSKTTDATGWLLWEETLRDLCAKVATPAKEVEERHGLA